MSFDTVIGNLLIFWSIIQIFLPNLDLKSDTLKWNNDLITIIF